MAPAALRKIDTSGHNLLLVLSLHLMSFFFSLFSSSSSSSSPFLLLLVLSVHLSSFPSIFPLHLPSFLFLFPVPAV